MNIEVLLTETEIAEELAQPGARECLCDYAALSQDGAKDRSCRSEKEWAGHNRGDEVDPDG